MLAFRLKHPTVRLSRMMEKGHSVSINPKQLDRFRDRLSPSGAKDDRRDAKVLAISLRTDPHCFRELQTARRLSSCASSVAVLHQGLTNQIRHDGDIFHLLNKDLSKAWIAELWRLAPTQQQAKRLRKATVEKLLKRHRSPH